MSLPFEHEIGQIFAAIPNSGALIAAKHNLRRAAHQLREIAANCLPLVVEVETAAKHTRDEQLPRQLDAVAASLDALAGLVQTLSPTPQASIIGWAGTFLLQAVGIEADRMQEIARGLRAAASAARALAAAFPTIPAALDIVAKQIVEAEQAIGSVAEAFSNFSEALPG